jgi:hypothetical protein
VAKEGQSNYELVVAAPGRQEYDVSLHLEGAPQHTVTSASEAIVPFSPASNESIARTDDQLEAIFASPAPHTESASTVNPQELTDPLPIRTDSAGAAPAAQEVRSEINAAGSGKIDRASIHAAPFPSLAAAIAIKWIPPVGKALRVIVPFDMQAVELELKQTLRRIDSLLEKILGDTKTERTVLRLAWLGAFVTAGQLALRLTRRKHLPPVLAAQAGNSSWSWVIGSAAPRRQP